MVSSFLAKLLQLDLEISEKIAGLTVCSSAGLIRTICLVVEWSMHGIPWLIGSVMAVIWSRLYANSCGTVCQYRISLLLLSILADLVVVGFLKILIRRERPPYNQDDQIYEAPIADKFSLPSGHSTRAAMLFVLFLKEHLSDQWFFNLLDLWFAIFVAIVAFSRVLMGRHFLSDVIIGILVGCIEAGILQSAFVEQKIFDRIYFLFI